jgi:hypothetical protein
MDSTSINASKIGDEKSRKDSTSETSRALTKREEGNNKGHASSYLAKCILKNKGNICTRKLPMICKWHSIEKKCTRTLIIEHNVNDHRRRHAVSYGH